MAGSGTHRGDAGLIAGLAAGETVAEAARRGGISERTAQRRLREPAFRDRLRQAREQTVQQAVAVLSANAAAAATTLAELTTEGASESVRLAAARTILEQVTRFEQLVNLSARLEVIEERLRINSGRQPR